MTLKPPKAGKRQRWLKRLGLSRPPSPQPSASDVSRADNPSPSTGQPISTPVADLMSSGVQAEKSPGVIVSPPPPQRSPNTMDESPDRPLTTLHVPLQAPNTPLISGSSQLSHIHHSKKSATEPASLIVASNVLPPSGTIPSPVGPIKDEPNIVVLGLKTSLRALKEATNLIPPFKPVIDGLLECMEIFPNAAKNQRDYNDLMSNISIAAKGLAAHFNQPGPAQTSNCVANVLQGLRAQIVYIKERQNRSSLSQLSSAKQDMDDLLRCYRQVEALFRQLQNDAVLSVWSIANEQLANMRLESLNPAKQARYDSGAASSLRRQCTPKTRQSVLTGLRDWASDPESPKIYWMNGMAGTGKTTIACSFCAELAATHRLAAGFFCSRSLPDCHDVLRIVPTVAHQLARFSYPFQAALCQAIALDPEIGTSGVATQFQKLLSDPLMEVKDAIPVGLVVVVDALDECLDRDGARTILDVLFRFARNLPVKFFVTCRPEPGLLDKLGSQGGGARSVLHLHDIELSFVQADIEAYLKDELASVDISTEQVKHLAVQSGKLFIYAATVVRYIKPTRNSADIRERLDRVLGVAPGLGSKAYAGIDSLYTFILSSALEGDDIELWEAENTRLVLYTVVCSREPMTVELLADWLKLKRVEQANSALNSLRSVLHTSESDNRVSILHASFSDYMLDEARSGNRYCVKQQHKELMSHRCFDVMRDQLRFNILDLSSSFVFDDDVPDIPDKIKRTINPSLLYACRYWSDHLGLVDAVPENVAALDEFLSHRLLFWVEVLNLKKSMDAAVQVLSTASKWLQTFSVIPTVRGVVDDAKKLVTVFGANPVCRSTPHLYLSILPFWSKKEPMWRLYGSLMRGLVDVEGQAKEKRGSAALAVWVAPSIIDAVAISVDGSRVVSGSRDGTIRIWDTTTGRTIVGPLEGHTSAVRSVAFSADGLRLVSGSDDQTIRIWDTITGHTIVGSLEVHTDRVSSVAFSADGLHVVSGSHDGTIRIWDTTVGHTVVGPLDGHTDHVTSVAFSADGLRVVSGSADQTIRIWDTTTGQTVVGPLKGHTDCVSSVAFSTDSVRIVSGSHDQTILIWDTATGHTVLGPLEGHTRYVSSVAFSVDGLQVVSGSYDHTIRIWDTTTGHTVVGPLEGHTRYVSSVTFSVDGLRVVSGSEDRTIRIWDTSAGHTVVGPLEGHTSGVTSVALSADGLRVVSGSYDQTIRIWDTTTGHTVVEPLGGHTSGVRSVAFSADSLRVVSGSHDRTIRIWDANLGYTVVGPLEGHSDIITSVAFSADGLRVVSGSEDRTIRVWDTTTGHTVVGPLEGHTDHVSSVAFSADGLHVVSGSEDQTIRIWDTATGHTVVGPLEGHTDWVTSVAFSADGLHIVSGSDDSTIRIWDTTTGHTVLGPLQGHTNGVVSVAFSADGLRIVSGSYDNTIRIWDITTGHTVIGPLQGHTDYISSVAFSADGLRVASGSHDRAIRIWDITTGYTAVSPLESHTNGVTSVAISANGPCIVSGSHDFSIRAWEAQNNAVHVGPSEHTSVSASSAAVPVNLPNVTFNSDHASTSNCGAQNQRPDIKADILDWTVNQDGWVVDRKFQLLLWIPPDLRTGLKWPQNSLVVYRRGSLELRFEDVLMGDDWHKCYHG